MLLRLIASSVLGSGSTPRSGCVCSRTNPWQAAFVTFRRSLTLRFQLSNCGPGNLRAPALLAGLRGMEATIGRFFASNSKWNLHTAYLPGASETHKSRTMPQTMIHIHGTPPKTHILYENYVYLPLPLTKHSCTLLWYLYFPKFYMAHFPVLASPISHWPLASPIFRISRFPNFQIFWTNFPDFQNESGNLQVWKFRSKKSRNLES